MDAARAKYYIARIVYHREPDTGPLLCVLHEPNTNQNNETAQTLEELINESNYF